MVIKMNTDDIKKIIYKIFEENDVNLNNINEDESLISNGTVDSMTFVNILLAIEEELNIEIDFENIDMTSIVTINSLCNTIYNMTN